MTLPCLWECVVFPSHQALQDSLSRYGASPLLTQGRPPTLPDPRGPLRSAPSPDHSPPWLGSAPAVSHGSQGSCGWLHAPWGLEQAAPCHASTTPRSYLLETPADVAQHGQHILRGHHSCAQGTVSTAVAAGTGPLTLRPPPAPPGTGFHLWAPGGALGPPQPLTPTQHTGLPSSRPGPPSPSLHDPLSRPRRALSLAPLTLLAHECHQQVLLLLTGLAKGDVPGAVVAAAVAGQHALHQGQKLQPPVPPEHLLRAERSLTHRRWCPLSPASRLGPFHLGKVVGAAQRGCLGSPRDHRGRRGHKTQVHLVLPWPLAPRRAHTRPAQGSLQVSQ